MANDNRTYKISSNNTTVDFDVITDSANEWELTTVSGSNADAYIISGNNNTLSAETSGQGEASIVLSFPINKSTSAKTFSATTTITNGICSDTSETILFKQKPWYIFDSVGLKLTPTYEHINPILNLKFEYIKIITFDNYYISDYYITTNYSGTTSSSFIALTPFAINLTNADVDPELIRRDIEDYFINKTNCTCFDKCTFTDDITGKYILVNFKNITEFPYEYTNANTDGVPEKMTLSNGQTIGIKCTFDIKYIANNNNENDDTEEFEEIVQNGD